MMYFGMEIAISFSPLSTGAGVGLKDFTNIGLLAASPGRQRLELCPQQWQQRLVCEHGQWQLEQQQHEQHLWCGAGLRFIRKSARLDSCRKRLLQKQARIARSSIVSFQFVAYL
jgi:hypothetical protein